MNVFLKCFVVIVGVDSSVIDFNVVTYVLRMSVVKLVLLKFLYD